MPNYAFPAVIAIDEPSGEIARSAEGQVYEVTDTAFVSPLPVTDLSGVPMTLRSSAQGVVPAFRVTATQPRVMWRSGTYVIEILSNTAVIDSLTATAFQAAAAQTSAQQSAEAVAAFGSSSVASVNGRTGAVNLTAADLGAQPAGSYVAASDPRLADPRTPTDGSVTNAKVAAGAGISLDKTADSLTRLAMTPAERTKLAATATVLVLAAGAPVPAGTAAGTVILRSS